MRPLAIALAGSVPYIPALADLTESIGGAVIIASLEARFLSGQGSVQIFVAAEARHLNIDRAMFLALLTDVVYLHASYDAYRLSCAADDQFVGMYYAGVMSLDGDSIWILRNDHILDAAIDRALDRAMGRHRD